MNRINDFAGLVATPLLDAEEGKKETNAKPALYQTGVPFQPAFQNFTAPNAPATPAAAGNSSDLSVLALLVNLTANEANGAPAGSSIGTSTSALTAGGNQLPDQGPTGATMPFYKQHGNACGTTTLAEIMSYLGVPMTQDDIDNVIRKLDTFTAPGDMVQFARDHGLEAEGYNNGSWDQVKAMIDAGHPVQALVEGDDSVSVSDGGTPGKFSVSGLHYIAITGYGTDPATGEQYVTYHDPNRGSEQRMSVSDFEKMWGNVPGGFNNYFMAYGAKGSNLPPGNNDGIQGTMGTLNGVTNITNGLGRIWPPCSFGGELHGIAETFGGIFQTVGCGIGAALQIGSSWLNNEVEGIPVLQQIVQPFGDLINGAGAVLGDVFNGFGEACNDVGNAAEDLFSGNFGAAASDVGHAIGDAASGVASAVGDAASAVGNAISDAFSGW
jgi:hypothetical protein